MKVTFWSIPGAHAARSVSALTFALWHAFQLGNSSEEHIAFLQTGFERYSSDYAVFGQQTLNDTYFGKGMDNLLSIARSRTVRYEDAYNSCFSLVESHMFYYTASRQPQKETFDLAISVLPDLVANLEDEIDHIYIDLVHTSESVTYDIMSKSDVIIVCIPQNELIIKQTQVYLEKLLTGSSISKENIFYCIGDFEKDSIYSVRNISKQFSINRKRIFCIPHNVDYADSLSCGKTVEFLAKNGNLHDMKKSTSDNQYFLTCLDSGLLYLDKEADSLWDN